jgi:hypothetical protein
MSKLTSTTLTNQRAFILAGGESVKKLDLNKLQGEVVISINKGFVRYPNAFINYSQDYIFYDKLTNGEYGTEILALWNAFKGEKVFLESFSPKKFDPNIFIIPRKVKEEISYTFEEGIYGGTNSGLGAILFTISLGCKEIYLLGYDLKAEKQTHWHGGYGQNINDFRKDLTTYLKEIYKIACILPEDVKIYNVNSDSALRCFEFKTLSEIL